MRYGKQIGLKFNPDGTARRYPGNTVIADIRPGNPAYAVMRAVHERFLASGVAPLYILLPEDSYHMTVIRGLNDQVRTDAFWPSSLDKNAVMEAVDRYVSKAVESVPNPGPIRMAFAGIRADEEDLRVLLRPADERQRNTLRAYRDRVADALSLRLPGHDEYTYHITLAYTLGVPEGRASESLAVWLREMESLLLNEAPFEVDAPYMAYYEDMLHFSPARNRGGR